MVFGGHCLIAENGILLAESRSLPTAKPTLLRPTSTSIACGPTGVRTNSFGDAQLYPGLARSLRERDFSRFSSTAVTPPAENLHRRQIEAHPFVPQGIRRNCSERCEEIFQTQVAGLAKRLEHIGKPPAVAIGVSGGLDSTLALLVTCKTMDLLACLRDRFRLTRCPASAPAAERATTLCALMQHLGVSMREVDIRALCLEEMERPGPSPVRHRPRRLSVERAHRAAYAGCPPTRREDLVFENVQARMRTSYADEQRLRDRHRRRVGSGPGLVTYNGDHMSMYNPNSSIPKTLVKFLVDWAAAQRIRGRGPQDPARHRRYAHLARTAAAGPTATTGQATEGVDRALRTARLLPVPLPALWSAAGEDPLPGRAGGLRPALHAGRDPRAGWACSAAIFRQSVQTFVLAGRPKVGSISLSPRGDWRMPSDAQVALWLAAAEGT